MRRSALVVQLLSVLLVAACSESHSLKPALFDVQQLLGDYWVSTPACRSGLGDLAPEFVLLVDGCLTADSGFSDQAAQFQYSANQGARFFGRGEVYWVWEYRHSASGVGRRLAAYGSRRMGCTRPLFSA